jgi:integrase
MPMASKVSDKHGNHLCAFRWGGKQYTRSLGTTDAAVADAGVAKVEETILRLKRGWLTMPADADPGTYIVSGGQLPSKPVVASVVAGKSTTADAASVTVGAILAQYTLELTPGAKGENTLVTEAIHREHLKRYLGSTACITFGLTDLDGYVRTRAKVSQAVTIKKELATLRVAWNWSHKRGHVSTPWAWKMSDLRFPKSTDKEPFRTWAEIERRITATTPPDRIKALWECLYLDERQVTEFLEWAKRNAQHPFIHPMLTFAAFTGARRGEILRSEIEDWNFANKSVAIRQTKGDSSKEFTIRHVPIHSALIEVMEAWFRTHPGGRYTITLDGRDAEMLPRMASKYFRQTVKGSKWNVLRGYHTFRHSLASIMASKGKDQRIIDSILGHSTEDMTRRYRHMFPSSQREAMDDLFG